MSPEQLAGRPATIRSDLFALGLVLYELFTGERAVRAESIDGIAEQLGSRDFPTPGTRVKDLDPAIEAMIMRCLEPRPEDRPPSASAVAAALPGGDAVAGVIASGQTPDPSLLAASGASGRVTMVAAAIWLIICAACVLLVAHLNKSASLLGVMGRTKSPEVLAERARETLRGLGLDIGDDARPGWSVWGVHTNIAMLDHIENSRPAIAPPRWWGALRSPPLESTLAAAPPPSEPLPPPAMEFWYRWSPRLISPELGKVIITATDPPPGPGDVCVRMDLQGRLIGLDAEPGARPIDAPSEQPAPWPALLRAAGLRDAWLTPAANTTDAASRGDARAAWTMNLSQPPFAGATAHVEAAALRGRPILFHVVWPWGAAVEAPAIDPFNQRLAMFGFVVPLIIAPVVAGAVMARRNWRAGRGDRRGALRVAAGIVILETAAWLLMADHSAALEEYDRVAAAIGGALLEGMLVWMIYLALEPAVRRQRPAAILAWTRLTSGRVGDAMVARDVLRGAALGAAWCVLYKAWVIIAHNFTDAPAPTIVPDEALRGVPAALAMILSGLSGSVQYGLLMLMGLLLWSRTGKWKWPARAGFGVFVFLLGFIILALLGQPQAANSMLYLQPWGLVTAIVYFFVLARLGLLTAVVMTTTMWTLCVLPATLESGRWYAPIGWTGVAAVIAAAAWGAWRAARVQARVAGGAAISDAGMTSRSAG
jgi:serine/threonine-protein kinase